jgi:hypothetical protein
LNPRVARPTFGSLVLKRYAAAFVALSAFVMTSPSMWATTWSQRDAAEPTLRLRATSASDESAVEKELDFSHRNDSAVMEATVRRGMPHRYVIIATKGQSLSAKLQSKEGARFDVYEPGSSLTLLSSGYVVQGTRVGKQDDGTHLRTKLPADGKYLLLVRPEGDQASYALELAMRDGRWTFHDLWTDRNVWAATSLVVVGFAFVMLYRRKRTRRIFRPD